MYDVIGDIHGHADALTRLLATMDYEVINGCWRHPDRQAVFLGDFIDRGPKIREVLDIVRPMLEEGAALAVMGNHELNAIGFHTPHPKTVLAWARERSIKNIVQYLETVRQIHQEDALEDHIAWFRTLPLWLDLDGLRIVHACWDPAAMAVIEEAQARLGAGSEAFFQAAFEQDDALFDSVEVVLKGREVKMDADNSYLDADNTPRRSVRTRWWVTEREGWTWRDCALGPPSVTSRLPNTPVPYGEEDIGRPYPIEDPPIFFGHYWMTGEPEPQAPNVACLDYSVAKGGALCAYRWDREGLLRATNFVTVPPH